MPQPLSNIRPTVTNFTLGTRSWQGNERLSKFNHAPQFATLAMDVIAEWSLVELDMIYMVSKLSGGTGEIAFQIYKRLNTSRTKSDAMMALIESKVRPQDMDIYDALRRFSKSCEKSRNKIAHNIWGHIAHREDVVLTVSPIHLIESRGRPDLHKVMVWNERDFTDLIAAFAQLGDCYKSMKKLGRGEDEYRDDLANRLRAKPGIQANMIPPR